ncbi:hypothetical protein [Streptosporangium roseum]|uniref:Uncharacterized protein n=1 Tax=Streptosporangium roseum (strain ATCC 12428 / DSM 43021 / JCM 3005 / KCTC 9067 / NCIMB 10171 / NRRL 2505 / NI 9100) TaxID=479432 RepID=D2B158_STRRD|nr:hypothetical protein [Streptosporangium roseum]ACZ83465.1 hypothetical protein Sros_0438 [Streptosporangium roseum DSM 43021]
MSAVLTPAPAPAPAAAEPPDTGDRRRLTVTVGLAALAVVVPVRAVNRLAREALIAALSLGDRGVAVDVARPEGGPDARRIDTVVCRMRFRGGTRTAGAA